MRILYFALFLSTFRFAYAIDDECTYFRYCGGSTSSKKSVNTSTSSIINPSNLAKIKGLGLETLFQRNNDPAFTIVTGNGKIGGALVSPSLENSFFGNRSLEIDDNYWSRFVQQKRYKNKKINLAIGLELVESKNFSLSLGFSGRWNPDIKKINPGGGLTTKLWIFNFGLYVYKDDVKLNLDNYINPYTGFYYSTQFGSSTYQESYLVKTATFGLAIKNLTLDVGLLNTKYAFYSQDTNIKIYSLAYNFYKFLFNYGIRQEDSPNLYISGTSLTMTRHKIFEYYGLQFLPNKNIMLGLGYNTFLMREISGTLTLFLN